MNKNLILYFGSMSLSLIGNGVATVLFPLLVLARTGDVFAAGLLASITAATGVIAGFAGGIVADRINRRTLSVVADLLSALSIALLAVIDTSWGVTLPVLIVLSVLGAFADIPGLTARETLLPSLVNSEEGSLDRLVGIRETLMAAMILVGPAVGGLLIGWLGIDSRVFWVTAMMSALAALLTLGISKDLGTIPNQLSSPTTRSSVKDLKEGVAFLFLHPITRAATILSAITGATFVVLQTTVIPAYFTSEGIPQAVGYVLSAIALGTVIGGGVYATASSRLSRRTWLNLGMIITGVAMIGLGALVSPWTVLGLAFIVGLVGGPVSAVLGVVTIDATDPPVLGRVLGTQSALVMAGPALLAAPMGALAGAIGIRPVGIVLGILVAVAALWSVWSRSFRGLKAEVPSDQGPRAEGESDGVEHQKTS